MTWIEYIKQSDQHALAALFSIGNMISTVMEPCTKWSIKRYVRELGDPASLDDMIHKLDQAQEYMNAHSDEISNDVVYHGLLHFVIIMNKQISENDLHHMDDMVESSRTVPVLEVTTRTIPITGTPIYSARKLWRKRICSDFSPRPVRYRCPPARLESISPICFAVGKSTNEERQSQVLQRVPVLSAPAEAARAPVLQHQRPEAHS